MSGAVILAARAAWRSGVGMVKLLVHEESLSAVREAEPSALTAPWPTSRADASRELAWADVVAIGPGLGVGLTSRETLEMVLGEFEGPIVLDADAINTFASDVNGLAKHVGNRPAILTPHPAEFGRITGIAVDDVLARRFDIGQTLAGHTRAVVLLKGQPTIVTAPSGERLVSASGTPLLAAAGSGDMLTGIVATLLAQIGDPLVAAACAAWTHGRAAQIAQRGQPGVRGLTLDHALDKMTEAWNVAATPTRYPVLLELPDLAPPRST
jgi:NAD(P)H-hydrate epimerase